MKTMNREVGLITCNSFAYSSYANVFPVLNLLEGLCTMNLVFRIPFLRINDLKS